MIKITTLTCPTLKIYMRNLCPSYKMCAGKMGSKILCWRICGKNTSADNVFIEINGNKINGREFQWEKYTIQRMNIQVNYGYE